MTMIRDALPRVDHRAASLTGLLILLCAAFYGLSPYFLTAINISNILLSVSVLGVMAAVSTIVIVGRGLDLSVGSIAALVGVTTALLTEQHHWGWGAAVLAGLGVGATCGAVNGALISILNINSIIATIGTLSLFRGVAFILTDGQTTLIENDALLFIGTGRILGVASSVWGVALCFVLCHLFATRTVGGRAVFAVGASPRAALLSGLPVKAIRFRIFVASGMSAAVSGLFLAGQSGTAIPSAASGYEVLVATAVLLGGTSLAGGEGSVLRTALGLLIIGVLNNGMALLAVPSFYQICANGLLLLLAVAIDQIRGKRLNDVEE